VDAVTYTPPADFIGTDTFTYSIRSSADLTAMATVTVAVVAVDDYQIEVDTIRDLPGGQVEILVYDVPGKTFGVEVASPLQPWRSYGYATPDTKGVLRFVDLAPDPLGSFYRFTSDINPSGPDFEWIRFVDGKIRIVYSDTPMLSYPFEISEDPVAGWRFFKDVEPNENGFLIVEDDPVLPFRLYRRPEP
jgi:hypothetical protein